MLHICTLLLDFILYTKIYGFHECYTTDFGNLLIFAFICHFPLSNVGKSLLQCKSFQFFTLQVDYIVSIYLFILLKGDNSNNNSSLFYHVES